MDVAFPFQRDWFHGIDALGAANKSRFLEDRASGHQILALRPVRHGNEGGVREIATQPGR